MEIQFVIVTGLSGAGKTQAICCLEDLGFFCVDNLPPALIQKFADLCAQSEGKINKIALVIDIRVGGFFDAVYESLDSLRAAGAKCEILFLDASDETLVRRFKESRRPHPLSPDGGTLEGIREERLRLEELKGKADKIIDTSALTTKELKELIKAMYGTENQDAGFKITTMSFGYKFGIPLDADLVFDLRFLPNPHYIDKLRPLTGDDKEVQDYVLESPVSKAFLKKLTDLINFLLPHYILEGKSSLTIAIGCTGGRHRSVTFTNILTDLLAEKYHNVTKRHRDIEKKTSGVK